MTPKLMGVVNVTPDSFSDGGLFLDADAAIEHGEELVRDGAGILDVGGESTRPGAAEVSAEEERGRTEPVVRALAEAGHTVSIDTSKLEVARAALGAGASIVNDVTALRHDPEIAALCAERDAGLVLMHMQGDPRTMQADPSYDDIVADVKAFLAERTEAAVAAGVPEERIWLDPGIGFGKTLEHNLELLRRLGELRGWGGRWSSAPRARASSARSTAPRSATESAARSPRRSSLRPTAPTSSASTTFERRRRR